MLHPTVGGLRIGKSLRDRKAGEIADPRLEWDQDGQYFHYLTKWMHALHQISAVTGDHSFHGWACELGKVAFASFSHQLVQGRPRSLYWKMSVDLSYPVVPSMGQHDALDGFVTYSALQQALGWHNETSALDLSVEIAELAQMCKRVTLVTDDPLGIGGMLFDAYRIVQLKANNHDFDDRGLLFSLLVASKSGLSNFLDRRSLDLPAAHRLAFREFGLSIGLHAISRMVAMVDGNCAGLVEREVHNLLDELSDLTSLTEKIESFWLEISSKGSKTWMDHEDINMVMLATSLLPTSFLVLGFPVIRTGAK